MHQTDDDCGATAEVTRLFECVICHQNLENAHLCPACSHPFCLKCIDDWLGTGSLECPYCRQTLAKTDLIRAYTIDQMQDAVHRLVSKEERNRCSLHKTRQLVLFCLPCEECICATCWFSEHLEHKDSAVPIEEIFDHYMKNIEKDFVWINERKELTDESLQQLMKNEETLNTEIVRAKETLDQLAQTEVQLLKNDQESLQEIQNRNVELHAKTASVMKADKDAKTLIEICGLLKVFEKLRLENPEKLAFRRFKNDIIPEPTSLVFQMERLTETIKELNFYESKSQSSCGFVWMVKLTQTGDNTYPCHVSLVKGKPGRYSAALGNNPLKELLFELNTPIEIGIFQPAIDVEQNDTYDITIHVRHAETYAQKCQQQKDYIEQLEAKIVDNEAFLRYLAEWEGKSLSKI